MGSSDSEINSRGNPKINDTSGADDLLASHTIHSYTAPVLEAESSVTATAPTPDEDADEESVTGSFTERFLKFLFKATPFARSAKMILWGLILGSIGGALFYYDQNLTIAGIQNVPSHFNTAAFALFGYGLLLATLHSIVVFGHRRATLYQSSLLHWLTEFEEYIAAGTWVTILLGLFASVSANWSKSSTDSSPLALSFIDNFIYIYLLAGSEPKMHIRLACIGLVAIVFSAVKRHFMHKLAIQFNYSNYCDRVEESLFIEDILQSLNKARQAYKFRKRWKLFLSDGRPGSPQQQNKKSTATVQMSDFVNVQSPQQPSNQINLKDFSQSPVASETTTAPNSPQFIDITSPLSPTKQQQQQTIPTQTMPTTTTLPTATDKKRQFEEFTRLCNRTATQFDSLSGADIRVEIHRESRRLAAQLFKWLCNTQRGDLSAAELEPFIDSPESLARFLGILKRSKKVPAHLQTSAFSEGDLRRAIDSALMERHGLAKSMETVEMALGKVDGILNFLLFVLVASLVERLFFSAPSGTGTSAASPLLSITTIFFSASFFFKDVAKSTFESIIFLLIIHPFDIGDRVYIRLDTTDNKAGGDCTDNLLVVEMNLMSTVFERWDGVRIYVPNNVLATKPIYNIRRSGPTTDLLRLAFAHSTRMDQLEGLRLRLHAFLKQNRQDFTEFHRVNVDALENCNKMNVTILIQHASNWQDFELQMARRTKIISFLKSSVEELGITYLPPVQRIELITSAQTDSISRIA
jgi:small-conductance mechanosensitive channel